MVLWYGSLIKNNIPQNIPDHYSGSQYNDLASHYSESICQGREQSEQSRWACFAPCKPRDWSEFFSLVHNTKQTADSTSELQ